MEKSSLKFADAGDASLLVFDIPEELTSSQSHAKCFVIPVLSRVGGLAMMIPLNALDQEKLLDELHHDGDGLLGPSKSFISELFSEDDDGNLVGSGVSCRFLVADFSDDILVFLHEYDDSLDEASEIIPFDSEHPSCLPSTFGIPEQVRAWAEEGATGCVHFYSAQEDPNVATPTAKGAPAVPKKQGAKKLTNSALAEMVQQLSVQVQALTAQSERSRNLSPKWPPQRAVVPAEEQPDGRAGLVGPRMPGVAESLQVGRAFGTPSMDAVHKAALSIGPPPKVRGIPKLPGGSPPNQVMTIEEEPKAWDQPGIAADPMLHALSQQSSALTTLVAHLTSASDPFGDLSAASSTGAAERAVLRQLGFLSPDAPTDAQAYVPLTSCTSVGPGVPGFSVVDADVSGKIWRIQAPSRKWTADVGAGSCGRLNDPRKSTHGSRASCSSSCIIGTGDPGWRRLEHCVLDDPLWRPTSASVPGSSFGCPRSHKTFCPVSPGPVVHGHLGLPERPRDHEQPEAGDYNKAEVLCSQGRRLSVAEAETEIPEKAKSFSGQSQLRKDGNQQDLGCPADQCSKNPMPRNLGDKKLPASDVKLGNIVDKPMHAGATSLDFELSLCRWCALLFTQVVRSRTAFSRFIISTLRISGSQSRPLPTMFPIPVNFAVRLDRMPSGLNAAKRRAFHFKRAVHLIAMCLNYLHLGGARFDASLLERKLSPVHLSIYHRLGCFLRSEDQFRSFRVIKAGRRFPELFARLSEISDAVTSLGLSGEPYSRAFQGHNLPPDNSVLPELEPYRSLNSDRLVIKGRGHWDPTEFIDDSLVMAYREPSSILCDNIPEEHERPRCNDPTAELVSLAKKWDENQLLYIHRFDVPKHQRVRIFNAWKNSQVDRQIGDRRGRNACECIVQGPSRRLPTGPDFCNFVCDPNTSSLRISVSDRKDYYHQLAVSESRAISNTVGQGIDSSLLKDTAAYSAFLISSHRKPKRDRLIVGDDLPGCRHPLLPEGQVAISFQSVLQGDHGGVEFATSAHEGLLSRFGCLTPRSRMTSEKPMFADDRGQGLVIDDFYAVSVEKHGARASDSWSHERLSRALDSYEHAALLGSPEKDLDAVDDGKVIGARLNSSKKALHQGVVSVGAPLEKRLALSWITLQLVILGFSTDHLHLCLLGGWVTALLYRRPLMCILQTAFGLVDSSYSSSSPPRIIKLPHSVRDELIVLAVLAPLVLTNIGALFGSHAFATDASQDMGAIVSSPMSSQMQSLLFRVCASKGSYTRMQNARDRLLADEDFGDDDQDYFPLPQPSRPPAFVYDFIEIFAGASTVTNVMADRGWKVGPPIELSLSPEFNMEFIHVISWLSWMISVGRVLSFMVEPPCTTFSIMRRPALRSRFCPFGFNVRDRQTMVGNLLAHRALLCLYLGHRFGVPGIFENPFSSLVRHLPSWKRVSMLPFRIAVQNR